MASGAEAAAAASGPASSSYPLSAERFVVLLRVGGAWRRLFQLQFERGRHGLGYYVHLPYFAHARGVLRRFTLDGPQGASAQVDLAAGGAATAQRVKYAHHADGEAHFSQDGKVLTAVRARTAPLRRSGRHLFTVHFWGADGFDPATAKDAGRPRPGRTAIGFEAPDQDLPPERVAGRVVARRYPVAGLRNGNRAPSGLDFARPVGLRGGEGEATRGIVLLPPAAQAEDFFVVLSFVPLERADDDDPSVVLLGGFHEAGPRDDPARSVGAIAIRYSERRSGWEDLVARIGSIDLAGPPGDEVRASPEVTGAPGSRPGSP